MDVGQIVVVVLAVLVGFFAKGVTGIGGPMLAVPVLAGFMGAEYAVVVIAIPTFMANCWLLWKTREGATGIWWFMTPLLIAGVFGTVLGAWILTNVDDRYISIFLAALVVAYIIWYFLGPDIKLTRTWAKRLSAPTGFSGGALAGATGIAAPVIATYIHALEMARSAFIFAVTLPFWTLGVVQLVSYASLGAYDMDRVAAGLVAAVPTLAVLPVATRLGEKMSHGTFQVAVLVVLAASAIRLVWSVF